MGRGRNIKPLTPEQEEQVQHYYDAGYGDQVISRVVGLTDGQVAMWRISQGLPKLTRGGKGGSICFDCSRAYATLCPQIAGTAEICDERGEVGNVVSCQHFVSDKTGRLDRSHYGEAGSMTNSSLNACGRIRSQIKPTWRV